MVYRKLDRIREKSLVDGAVEISNQEENRRTLAEEREVEIIKEGLNYVMEDVHKKGPPWDAR